MTKSSPKTTELNILYIYQTSKEKKLAQMDGLLNNKQTDLSERQKIKCPFCQFLSNL